MKTCQPHHRPDREKTYDDFYHSEHVVKEYNISNKAVKQVTCTHII